MADAVLERRLRDAARALDGAAPSFDRELIVRARSQRRGRRRVLVAALAVAAVTAIAAQPAALSSVARFLGVISVDELGPAAPDVTAPFAGRPTSREEAESYAPFRVHDVGTLGDAVRVHVRDDVGGGMVSLSYAAGVVLTQWAADEVEATVEVAASLGGAAEDVTVGGRDGVWVAGEARGTFRVVGADGAFHREAFLVRDGALAWRIGGVGLLLQGAGSKEDALRLAASVR